MAGARRNDQRRLLAERADGDREAMIALRQTVADRQSEALRPPLLGQALQIAERGAPFALLAALEHERPGCPVLLRAGDRHRHGRGLVIECGDHRRQQRAPFLRLELGQRRGEIATAGRGEAHRRQHHAQRLRRDAALLVPRVAVGGRDAGEPGQAQERAVGRGHPPADSLRKKAAESGGSASRGVSPVA